MEGKDWIFPQLLTSLKSVSVRKVKSEVAQRACVPRPRTVVTVSRATSCVYCPVPFDSQKSLRRFTEM